MLKPQRTKAPSDPKTHWGFSETGSFFRSEIKVENAATRFALWIVGEITDQFLSPQDVHFVLLREGTSGFRAQTIEQWATLDQFWQWPCAMSFNPLEEFVRSSLGGKHPWLRDEYLWTRMCDSAEKKYNRESRVKPHKAIRELLDEAVRS